ncbi:MAG: exodeoxyribonuclease VII small subunit [bacterium]
MKEIKFEQALSSLEKIVQELEQGNFSLEDAIKKYEEGIVLSKFCNKKLNEAEKKIEILTKTIDENFELKPFVLEEK